MFIKKIFEKKIDDSVHQQFIRFGKGQFNGKAIINMRISPSKIRITTSFELINELVNFCSTLVEKLKVSGVVLSKEKLNLENEKSGKLYQYTLDKELNKNDIKYIIEKCYFALLNIESPGILLKVKSKLPKPGKDELKDNFCILELDLKYKDKAKQEFFWDVIDFKKARSEHSFEINDIVIPKELVKEKDFAKIRLMAKRKGKLIRKTEIDGIVSEKKLDFEA